MQKFGQLSHAYNDFAKFYFGYFFYTLKHTFWGGLAPFSQTVGSLLVTPGRQSRPEK